MPTGRGLQQFKTGLFSGETSAGKRLLNCASTDMKMKQMLPSTKRLCLSIAALLMLSIVQNAQARDLAAEPNRSLQALAFARYPGSHDNGDLFNQSRPVAILIDASLPGLYKRAELLAVRDRDESARPKYYLLAVGGDGTVLAEVIGRYLEAAQQMDDIPASSLAITPANDKFHFAGEVRTGATPAFIYRITPKRSGAGLLNGQLWMDSRTGAELVLSGHVHETALDRWLRGYRA